MTRSNKLNLPLGRRLGVAPEREIDGHHTQVIVAGKGSVNFDFPEIGTLVSNAVKRDELSKAKGKKGKKETKPKASRVLVNDLNKIADDKTIASEAIRFFSLSPVSAFKREEWQAHSPRAQALKLEFQAGIKALICSLSPTADSDEIVSNIGGLANNRPVTVLPPGQTKDSYEDGKVLLKVADLMQNLMMSRQFDGLYEARFGRLVTAVEWALANMEAEYQPAFHSLNDQLEKLIDSYKQALPQVIAELSKRNPGAPLMAVVQKAIELLDEELAQILYVLRVYTDCVEQRRDGKFTRQLDMCAFFFKCIHQMYWTGDLEGALKGTVTSPIKGGEEKVGAVFLARVTASGLATIPGRGPIGAHALQVPYEMLDFLVVNFPLFCHEARHNVFHDVVGLEEQALKALAKDIANASKAGGSYTPSVPFIMVGKQKVPTAQMMGKIYTDWLGEEDADALAVMFTGVAFGESMVASFPAMMIRDAAVSTKTKLLRTTSHFDVVQTRGGGAALQFEPHPIDYVRVYLVAALFEEIGFKDAADKLRALADFAVGDEIPDVVTFEHSDEEGKNKLEIEVPTKDFLALAPVVAKSLIRTKHAALGGKSNADLVVWTQKRQDKVDLLKEILMSGKNDVPEDKGDIHVTYVASAAISATYQLVREGKATGPETLKAVSENAMVMLETLKARAEKAKAA